MSGYCHCADSQGRELAETGKHSSGSPRGRVAFSRPESLTVMTCRVGIVVTACSPARLRGYGGRMAGRLASVLLWTQLRPARLAPLRAGKGCPHWAEAAPSVARGTQDGPRSPCLALSAVPLGTRRATQRGPDLGDHASLLPPRCGARPGDGLNDGSRGRTGPCSPRGPHLAAPAVSAQVWSCCSVKCTTPSLPAWAWLPPSPRPPCSGYCRDGS